MTTSPFPSRLHAGIKSSTSGPFLALLAAAILALGGCALSPQTVALTPLVDVGVPTIGRDRSLALTVTDARASPVFGSRGGLYSETALLTPRNDVAQSLRQALGERLAAAGFRVVAADTPAPLSLDVRIRQLDYRLDTPAGPGGGVVNDARAEAVLDAVLTNAGNSHGARYQASSVRRVVGYPSETDNAALLNEVVARSLRQLLQDPQLLALLAE